MPCPEPDRNWRNFLKFHRSVWIEISLFWQNAGGSFPDRNWAELGKAQADVQLEIGPIKIVDTGLKAEH